MVKRGINPSESYLKLGVNGHIKENNCVCIVTMARVTADNNKNGKVGGLVYYKLNGKQVVRAIGKVSKLRLKKSKSFSKMRENMSEFGAASKVGKVIRDSITPYAKQCGDPYVSGRLNAVVKRIIANGQGEQGRRCFDLLANKAMLEGFEFNGNLKLGSLFYPPNIEVRYSNCKHCVSLLVPDFNTDNYINAPNGATHFRLVLAVSALSNYIYHMANRQYEPVSPIENGANAVVLSPEVPLGGRIGNDITFDANLDGVDTLPLSVGVISSVGIIFYQEVNLQLYELVGRSAIRVVMVG